jgi:hypothetical protein
VLWTTVEVDAAGATRVEVLSVVVVVEVGAGCSSTTVRQPGVRARTTATAERMMNFFM